MKITGELSNKLLKYIVVSGAVCFSLQNPKVIKELYKLLDQKIKKSNLKRSLEMLEERDFIDLRESAVGLDARITEKGRKYIQKLQISSMKIEKPKHWDGKWRLVIFDIPEKKKKSRDSFAGHLKSLGLFRLQDSVFIHPYDCKNEIIHIANICLVSNYVNFGILIDITKETILKKHFHLQ